MTRELKRQQDALVLTNAELSARHNFIEAVLSGVSAGVIGLDSADHITLLSRSAERSTRIFGCRSRGKPLADVVPEFAGVLSAREENGLKSKGQHEIKKSLGDEERTFAVGSRARGRATAMSVTSLPLMTFPSLSRRNAPALGRISHGASRTKSRIPDADTTFGRTSSAKIRDADIRQP